MSEKSFFKLNPPLPEPSEEGKVKDHISLLRGWTRFITNGRPNLSPSLDNQKFRRDDIRHLGNSKGRLVNEKENLAKIRRGRLRFVLGLTSLAAAVAFCNYLSTSNEVVNPDPLYKIPTGLVEPSGQTAEDILNDEAECVEGPVTITNIGIQGGIYTEPFNIPDGVKVISETLPTNADGMHLLTFKTLDGVGIKPIKDNNGNSLTIQYKEGITTISDSNGDIANFEPCEP